MSKRVTIFYSLLAIFVSVLEIGSDIIKFANNQADLSLYSHGTLYTCIAIYFTCLFLKSVSTYNIGPVMRFVSFLLGLSITIFVVSDYITNQLSLVNGIFNVFCAFIVSLILLHENDKIGTKEKNNEPEQ